MDSTLVLKQLSFRKDETKPIMVLLVDDHEIVRNGLKMILQNQTDIEVMGEASNCDEAIEQIRKKNPDVILLDVKMPGKDGFATMEEIKKVGCESPILLLSGYNYEFFAQDAIESQSSGFITKDSTKDFILNSIRLVVRGGLVWERDIFRKAISNLKLQQKMQLNNEKLEHEAPLLTELLSPREQEVLQFLSGGAANKEISRSLSLSEISVKKLVASIIHKLGVKNRTQAALAVNKYTIKDHFG
ncbi:MAG: response regulator transcription factor [Dehalogenimonas sp.]